MMLTILSLLLIPLSAPVLANSDPDGTYVCSIHRHLVDRQGRAILECEGSVDLSSKRRFEPLKKCNAAVELVFENMKTKVMMFDTYEYEGKLRAYRTAIVEFPEAEVPSTFTLRILRETNKDPNASVRILEASCSKI